MSTIDTNLEIIRTAVYGKDMRQAIHDAIAELNNTLRRDNASAYTKWGFKGVHPEYTITNHNHTVTDESTMYGESPYFLIPADGFDPSKDGLLVWRNVSELIWESWYYFDTSSVEGQVKVCFNQSGYYHIGDQMQFTVYRKPQGGGSAAQTYGTSAVYAPLGLSASTIATNMTDFTPNLKSVSDTADSVRSSIDLGWLCTNVGGVGVVFVMHRCAVSISDGVGGVWQQISVTHNTQNQDADYILHGMSVFWRQVDGNIPLHITVTAADSQRLYASAVIYEGKTSVSLVERTNEVTYETLYYNVTDQKDGFVSGPSVSGIDMWCLTVEYLSNYWVTALDTTYDPSDAEVSHPDSGETDRLSIYAGGGTRCIYYVNDNAQCKNYLGFYIGRNNIINSEFESAVQFLHVLIT